MRQFILLFCCLFFVLTISSQVIGQPSYIFHHLKTENGLSNSSVRAILKDSYGFLWIGTASGLNRYDGYGFKIYTMNLGLTNTLWANDILDLKEDGLGNIWIYCSLGLIVYQRDKDGFITDIPKLLYDLGFQVELDYKVYVDKMQDLWVFSKQKAFLFDTRKKTLKVFEGIVTDKLTNTEISDDGKSLYSIIKPGLLWQINKQTGNQTLLELQNLINPEIIDADYKIYTDPQSGLWLYSYKSDAIYYQKSPKSDWDKLVLSSSVKTQSYGVLDILDDENGHIWIGTDHMGLFIYDRTVHTITNQIHDQGRNFSIASNNVGCLYKDNNGIIWMGHNKKGVSYYHDSFRNIINIEQAECKDINAIMEDRYNNIWLGTDGNGLYVIEKKHQSNIQKLPMQNNAIVSLLEDRKGRVWIGTYLNGLFCYENGEFKNYTKENSKLASNDIWNLKEDRFGNLWIGCLAGGIQWLKNDKGNFDTLVTACDDVKYPLDMYYDGGDKLYVATVYGLCIIDILTGKQAIYMGNNRKTQEFKQKLITCVYKDERDKIWLGHTLGLTIWDLKKDSLYYIDKGNGLCDNIVRGIIEDNHRNIWVSTSNGLSVLTTERDGRGALSINSRNFSTNDGLKDNYFNDHSICKLDNGNIILGGTEGYAIVNPNKMAEKNQPLAKVFFTELSIWNNNVKVDSLYNGHKLLEHPMEQTSSLTFSYKDKQISFEFTTDDLLNADKVKYVYKLEGFNDQWLPAQGNKIEFSSLAPGSYKLFIKACNSDGIWNEEATVLPIKVTPPFYSSKWALLAYYIFVFCLILFIIYRTRKNHRLKLEKQRIQIEQEQEANLNEMKLRFFTNISHDLRTPLTLILTPLQTLLNGALDDLLRKKLNTINKNAEQLLQLINSLLDFRKLDVGAESLHLQIGDFVNFIREACVAFNAYAIERNMNFTFSSEMESISMQFDPDKVHKILFNLLSNAFKYTPDKGSVNVYIYKNVDSVGVSVSDSGPGINETDKKHIFERFYQASQHQDKTGSGIGLHIVSEYVKMHGGSVTVTDNKPIGSIFAFILPVQEVNPSEELNPEDVPDEEEVIEMDKNNNLQKNPVLLFVDDNNDFCDFMADSLSDEYAVIVAHNGQEALNALNNDDINVVVSDVMMPVMNGIELCNRIKTNIEWSHIPVILLTARTDEEYKLKALELGADDYITKPFNFNLLKLRIRKFLEWREKCHLSFIQKMDVAPSEITITSLDEKLIEKAIKFVEDHISDTDFSVEELSEAVGLSRSHLYKKLMSITGKGPAEFIRTIRLKRGRQLLEKSQLQIAEIAYIVGFNSPKRFTINFRNEFGMSPSEYLRIYKEQE